MATRTLYPSTAPSLDLNFAGSKTLDPRITFSRASAATYYDGKTVAKAEENLLTYSQAFDNATWDKGAGSTIFADTLETVAPNGTNTADKIAETATTSSHRAAQSSLSYSSGQFSASVFWKKGTRTWVWLSLQVVSGSNTTTQRQWFNLDTISAGQQIYVQDAGVTSLVSFVSSSITDVGNGWRRCVLTVNGTSATGSITINTGLADADASLSYAGSVDQYGYLWGAQLEQRSQVTAYTPTTTQPITNYIPVLQTALAGVPRFDHNPVTGESLGLLVEEQRTNLLTYSEQFDNAAWVKTGPNPVSYQGTGSPAVVTANFGIAPDGTLTADRVVLKLNGGISSNDRSGFYRDFSSLSLAPYSSTIYLKPLSSITEAQILDSNICVLAAGGTASGRYLQSVGNGWYRLTQVVTPNLTAGTWRIQIAGGGVNPIDSIEFLIWGAQLEAGSFPTSYVKTESSQVTRAADSASMTGANFSSWYRQDEGTLLVDAKNVIGATVFSTAIFTDDSVLQTTNRLAVFNRPNGVVGASALITYNSSEQISNSFTFKESNKVAVAYKFNDTTSSLNGAVSSQDTSVNIPSFTKLRIGQLSAGSDFFTTQTIKRLTYYPKRLTDAQLQALTL